MHSKVEALLKKCANSLDSECDDDVDRAKVKGSLLLRIVARGWTVSESIGMVVINIRSLSNLKIKK